MIVVALPGESDVEYVDYLEAIADFFIEFDGLTKGRDHLFIIHDKSGQKYLGDRHTFTNAHLIEVEQAIDMWMRDYPPAMPKRQIRFTYEPQYLNISRAKFDVANFEKFASVVGLPLDQTKQSDIILEGGNIVENGVDAAITTERTLDDNWSKINETELVRILGALINRKVALIPDPDDTTGHADGIVSFVEKDVLLIAYYEDNVYFFNLTRDAVLKVFPNLTIVPLPSYLVKSKVDGFDSAEGCYVNALVTNNAVYLPFFKNKTFNERAFAVFKNNTKKEVIPVHNTGDIPVLGGSVRCMTWQIDQEHPNAKALLAYVNKDKPTVDSSAVILQMASIVQVIVQVAFALAFYY